MNQFRQQADFSRHAEVRDDTSFSFTASHQPVDETCAAAELAEFFKRGL
jgi:hypothetical protein